MPQIISISKIDFPHKTPQSELKKFAEKVFSDSYDEIDRMLNSFENTKIQYRNLSVPVDYFYEEKSFEDRNDLYIEYAVKYSVEAISKCLLEAGINKKEITDIVFISTTGLSTPSIDAMIVNELRLNENINRTPIWGLGCAGGAAGISKANVIAKANPKALVLVVAVELCSLTFIRNDLSKSNFIATSLFSDGVAAALVTGDEINYKNKKHFKIEIIDSHSKLYYESLDVMGWDILNDGFKVVFSKYIPTIVRENVKNDILDFLSKNNLGISDIKNFVCHPGGIKVINAYLESLELGQSSLKNTLDILTEYGNMSSATVLYVLERFVKNGFEDGYGLMMSLGPGFSSEIVLLSIINY